MCRYGVREAKALLKLNLVKHEKGNKEGFYRHISSRRKLRENMGLLLNEAGDLITKDVEKAKVLFSAFTLVFIGNTCLQESQGKEYLVKEHLNWRYISPWDLMERSHKS